MTGGSPGSSMLYETPLYVVPTSKAKTSFRADPWYGCRSGILQWGVEGLFVYALGRVIHDLARVEAYKKEG